MQTKPLILGLLSGLALSSAANAALIDRGGGLIYDDVLNITWLQDANYAKTSGYDTDGMMNWGAANTWAAGLVFHDSVRNVDYSDWRLPTVTDSGAPGCDYAYVGTDCGYNSTGGEMAFMYYTNLGLKGFFSTTGDVQPDYGIFGNGTVGGQADVGLIDNLQSHGYWSGTAYAPDPTDGAWYFYTYFGSQDAANTDSPLYAWAVRPGDVAAMQAVPEPGSLILLGLGLAGLGAVRRGACNLALGRLQTQATTATVDFRRFAWTLKFVAGIEGFVASDPGIQHVDPEQADQGGIELIDDSPRLELADIGHGHDGHLTCNRRLCRIAMVI